MKFILFLIISFHFHSAFSQNKNIYIKTEGGTKKILTLGRYGYNRYYFTNNPINNCDTLICTGSGLYQCKISRRILKTKSSSSKYFSIYNSVINTTFDKIRKTGNSDGQFNLILKNEHILVKYYNANKRGNAEIKIEIL